MINSFEEDEQFNNLTWLPLDNPSKIFLSTMTSVDTKVFRISASLKQPVQVDVLEQAVNFAYQQYPLYHAIIRRGFFWYFAEQSDSTPLVEPEKERFCAQIYHSGHRDLLFRILYNYNRIELEIFHALSDGAGALNFFQMLLLAYFKFEGEKKGEKLPQIFPIYTGNETLQDAFRLFDFGSESLKWRRLIRNPTTKEQKSGKVLRLKGEPTHDFRPNILELHYSTKAILAKAKASGGTITTYLAAVFSQALYLSASPKQRKRPCRIVLSCPVDLRQHYINLTARNFFATTYLSFTFPAEKQDGSIHVPKISEIVAVYNDQLKKASSKEEISRKVAGLVRLEKTLPLRIVPLYIKDFILRISNSISSRGISGSISNVGRFRLPDRIKDKVEDVTVGTATVRPQFSIISYEQDLSITITSALNSTKIQNTCREILINDGLNSTFTVESKIDNLSKGQIIEQTKEVVSSQQIPYPEVPIETKLSLASFILNLITIFTLSLYLILNLIFDISLPLSAILLTLASLWLSTMGVLRNRHNPAWSIVLQSLIFGIGIVGIDLFTGYAGWSLTWALPGLFLGSLIANEIVLTVSKRAQKNGFYFLFTGIILGFLPLLFIALNLVKPIWPSLVTAGSALFLLIINLIFHHRQFREETKKKWHF